MTASALVTYLSEGIPLNRTGVVLGSPDQIRNAQELAVRLNVEAVDIIDLWLRRLPAGTKYVGVSASSLLDVLEILSAGIHQSRCLLVVNLDILLARLDERQLTEVWTFLFSALKKQQTGLLILLPTGADHLLTPGEAERWLNDGRLARVTDNRLNETVSAEQHGEGALDASW